MNSLIMRYEVGRYFNTHSTKFILYCYKCITTCKSEHAKTNKNWEKLVAFAKNS